MERLLEATAPAPAFPFDAETDMSVGGGLAEAIDWVIGKIEWVLGRTRIRSSSVRQSSATFGLAQLRRHDRRRD